MAREPNDLLPVPHHNNVCPFWQLPFAEIAKEIASLFAANVELKEVGAILIVLGILVGRH